MRTDTDSELGLPSGVSSGSRLAKVLGALLAFSIALNVVIGAYWLQTVSSANMTSKADDAITLKSKESKDDDQLACLEELACQKASYTLLLKRFDDKIDMRDRVLRSKDDNATLTSPIEKAYKPSEPYDPDYAKTAALYASAAYCPPNSVRDWSAGFSSAKCKALPADSVETFQSKPGLFRGSSFGYVAVDKRGKHIVVTFKGTNGTFADIIADLDTSFKDIRSYCIVNGAIFPGQYHPGFCWYYTELVEAGLAEAVAAAVLANPDFDLLYTGHSLGGAIALIGVTDVLYRLKLKPKRTILYTFGSPRAGNSYSAAYLQGAIDIMYRVTHGKDPAVHFPPCFLQCPSGLCPFSSACVSLHPEYSYHVATEVFYNGPGDQDYKICNGWGEDPTCSNSQWGFSIDDHAFYVGIAVSTECCY
jgi:hypothetical protein